jgi:phage repressor protein C with HTH and peptisase S24 domain
MGRKAMKPSDLALGQRIAWVRKNIAQSSQERFADSLGVQRGAVGNWELGKGASRENIATIAQLYGVPYEWLSTGNGGKPAPSGLTYHDDTELEPDTLNLDCDLQAFSIEQYQPKIAGARPELDVSLGSGEGKVGELVALRLGDQVYEGHKVVAEWFLPDVFLTGEVRATKSQTVILPVVGDSMYPTYNFGDRVIVDLNQAQFVQDAVYAISDGSSAPRIKRLQYVFKSTPAKIRILSDNPQYAPEEHYLSDVVVIGRVCGIMARR